MAEASTLLKTKAPVEQRVCDLIYLWPFFRSLHPLQLRLTSAFFCVMWVWQGGGATEATAIEPFDVSLDEDWDDAIEPATGQMTGADEAIKHTVGEEHKTHIEAGEDEVQGFDDETEVEVIDL